MNNPYIRFAVILSVPMLIGFGIGYGVRSAPAEQADGPAEGRESSQEVPGVRIRDAVQDEVTVSRKNAITEAVAKNSPTVVGINVTQVRQIRDPLFRFFGDDPFFRQFFGDRTYRQEVKGLGSGFIVSPDGYIVTNDHVAGNATEVTVTLVGGRRLKAEVVGTDPLSDICLLKVDGEKLPSVTIGNSDDIIIGEWAIALGNPFGLFEINDKPTVTVGVISSTGMNLGSANNRFYRDMIETDAAINGGNSGGPLINSHGEVIGVNTLIFTGGQSSTFVGYGFAIPINKVMRIVAELKKKGKVSRDISYGFDFQQVDARIAQYFGMTKAEGIIVSEVRAGGPADRAGLKVGDIVMQVNNEKIVTENDFFGVVVDGSPGDVLRMNVYRERKLVDVNVTLEKAPS